MSAKQAQDLLHAAQALLRDLWTRPDLSIDSLRLMDDLQAVVDETTGVEA